MNAVSLDIVGILNDAGMGYAQVDGKRVRTMFIGTEPARARAGPNTVTIYDTGGIDLSDRLAINHHTIQFRARNQGYTQAYNALHKIRQFLEAKESIVKNDTLYVGFWVVGAETFGGKDENDLFWWTLNFRTMREPSKAESGHRLTLRQ